MSPLELRLPCQLQSKFAYVYPAASIPCATIPSTNEWMSASVGLHQIVLYGLKPIGGPAYVTGGLPPSTDASWKLASASDAAASGIPTPASAGSLVEDDDLDRLDCVEDCVALLDPVLLLELRLPTVALVLLLDVTDTSPAAGPPPPDAPQPTSNEATPRPNAIETLRAQRVMSGPCSTNRPLWAQMLAALEMAHRPARRGPGRVRGDRLATMRPTERTVQ
jgi:hypothetical protein